MSARQSAEIDALTDEERASLMRWRNRNYGALFKAVERIKADAYAAGVNEARGIQWRVETACDGYENLTDEDVPGGAWTDAASYQQGAADAARAIRGVLAAPSVIPPEVTDAQD